MPNIYIYEYPSNRLYRVLSELAPRAEVHEDSLDSSKPWPGADNGDRAAAPGGIPAGSRT